MDVGRLLETAFALASVLILGKSYKDENERAKCANQFRAWLEDYSKAGRAFSNVMLAGRHFKDIFAFFRDAFFSAAYWIFGSAGVNSVYSNLLSSLPAKITQWADQVLEVSDPRTRLSIPTNAALRDRIAELYRQSREINLDLLRIPNHVIATHMVSRLITTIFDLHTEALACGSSATRVDPHATVFCGPPGVGKSVIMMRLTQQIAHDNGWNRDESVYNLAPGAKYFDNFNPSTHMIHVIDDMSQFSQPDTDTGPMVIQAKTNSAFQTPQADLASKGRKFYQCKYIIGSCNDAFPTHTGVLRCDAAFYRRRNLLFDVRFSTDWCKKTGFNPSDPAHRLADYLSADDKKTFAHLVFQRINPTPNFDPVSMSCTRDKLPIGDPVTFQQMMMLHKQHSDHYLQQQEELVASLRAPLPDDEAQAQGPSDGEKLTFAQRSAAYAEAVARYANSAARSLDHSANFHNEIAKTHVMVNDLDTLENKAESAHIRSLIVPHYGGDGFLTEIEYLGTVYPKDFVNRISIAERKSTDDTGVFKKIWNRAFGSGLYEDTATRTVKLGEQAVIQIPLGHEDAERYHGWWKGLISQSYRPANTSLREIVFLNSEDEARRKLVLGVRADCQTFFKWAKEKIKELFLKSKAYLLNNKKFFICLAAIGALGYFCYRKHVQADQLAKQITTIEAHHWFHDGIQPEAGAGAYSSEQKRLATIRVAAEGMQYSGDMKRLPRVQTFQSEGAMGYDSSI
jgi:hypothetical protein